MLLHSLTIIYYIVYNLRALGSRHQYGGIEIAIECVHTFYKIRHLSMTFRICSSNPLPLSYQSSLLHLISEI